MWLVRQFITSGLPLFSQKFFSTMHPQAVTTKNYNSNNERISVHVTNKVPNNYKVTLQLNKVTWSALGPGNADKLRLEPMPEQLQRCGWPHLLWQAVPNGRCSSSSKGTVTDRGTLGATSNECRGRCRTKSLPWADGGDMEQFGRQVGRCSAMEAAIHEQCTANQTRSAQAPVTSADSRGLIGLLIIKTQIMTFIVRY